MARRRKPRTPHERLAAAGALFLAVGVVAAAQRDLYRRAQAEIRGSKRIWQLLSLNALGALVYLVAGRRPTR